MRIELSKAEVVADKIYWRYQLLRIKIIQIRGLSKKVEHWKLWRGKDFAWRENLNKDFAWTGAFSYKELYVTDIFSKKGSINTRNIEIS